MASESAAREVREFLATWLVLMVIGSLPGLALLGLIYGAGYVLGARP